MSYDIYWNKHRNLFSVRRNGRVVGHVQSVNAFNASFVVQPAGQRKVRETGTKTVHAFIRTNELELLEPGAPPMIFKTRAVRYDPKTMDGFQLSDGTPVSAVSEVSLRIRNNHPEILV